MPKWFPIRCWRSAVGGAGGARRGAGAAAARSPSPPARWSRWPWRPRSRAPDGAGAPAPEPPAAAEAGGAMPSGFGRALIEKLPTPLLVVSRTGRVGYANPAAQEALPRLQPGAHFAHLIRAPAFVEAVTATLADGEERRVRFATHQGRERFFEARVGLLPPGRRLRAGGAGHRADRGPHRDAAGRAAALGLHRQRQPRAPDAARLDHRLHRDAAEPRAGTIPRRASGSSAIMAREAGRMQRLVDDLMSLSRIEMSEHVPPGGGMVAEPDRRRERRGAAAGGAPAGGDAGDRRCRPAARGCWATATSWRRSSPT